MAHNDNDESVTVEIDRDALALLSPSSRLLIDRVGYRFSASGLLFTITRGEVATLLRDIHKRVDHHGVR